MSFTRLQPGFTTPSTTLELKTKYLNILSSSLAESNTNIFEVKSIFNEKQLSRLNTGQVFLTYDTSTQYNFYTDYYEQIIKNENGPVEPVLPSAYVVGDKQNYETTAYKDIITVKNEIKVLLQNNNENTVYEYFDEFAKLYKKRDSLSITKFNFIKDKQQAFYFTKQGVNRLAEINENKVLFPYYNTLEFSTHRLSQITDVLESSNFIDEFCKDITNLTFRTQDLNILTDTFQNLQYPSFGQQIVNEELFTVKFDDIQSFILNFKNFILSESNITSFGDVPAEPQSNNPIRKIINLNITAGKLIELLNSLKQTPEEFVKQQPIDADLIMYELQKIPLNENNPIQTVYLPNLSNIDKIIYNDSQVKFGKIYNYKLSGYYFSLQQLLDIPKISRDLQSISSAQIDGIFSSFSNIPEIIQKAQDYNEQANTGIIINPGLGISAGIINAINNSQNTDKCEETPQILNPQSPQLLQPSTPIVQERPQPRPIDSTGAGSSEQQKSKQYYNFFTELMTLLIQEGKNPFIYQPIIFKRDIFTTPLAVYDKPPPPPDIEIDGMIGVDNKILIRLNKSISEIKAKPVIIQPEDQEIFAKNVLFQNLRSLEDEMSFDGDDNISNFQIFRLDYQPTSYEQFRDSYITASTFVPRFNSDTSFTITDGLRANHSSYLDTIEANKKYYYIFRTVDIHGNLSNPSPVYEVETVNADGSIFPIINIVDLQKEELKQPTKNIRRFLHISPNALQSLINEKDSAYFKQQDGSVKNSASDVTSVKLGISEEKMWDKKYRLKIRSKLTGKLVEIDFKFTHKTILDNN